MANDSTQPETEASGSEPIPTLEVPAEFYDEALAFCNNRLREQGKSEIDALPSGMPGSPWSCPCGKACGVLVGAKGLWWNQGPDTTPLDGSPGGFVEFFDKHAGQATVTLPIRAKAGAA